MLECVGLLAESLTAIMKGEEVIMLGQDAILAKISVLSTVGTRALCIGFGVVGILAVVSIVIGYLNSRKLDEIQRELEGARR